MLVPLVQHFVPKGKIVTSYLNGFTTGLIIMWMASSAANPSDEFQWLSNAACCHRHDVELVH
jgi:hypothetical protein